MLTIGDGAFKYCEELTVVTAPKVQTIGASDFADTGLTSVDLPEAMSLASTVFYACFDVTDLHLPKVIVLGHQALDLYQRNNEVTIYLTSADAIVVDENCFYVTVYYGNLETSVNLVLNNNNKQSVVNENTWTTKDAGDNDVSFTFKSITFADETE